MKLTILEEARYRLTCCILKTGDGWDDCGLRNYRNNRVWPRLCELKPFVEQMESLCETDVLRTDLTTVKLVYEYRDLVSIERDIHKYFNPPLVELEREPKHHVCPMPSTPDDLCYIVRKADHGDYIHCSHEAHQKMGQTECHQAQEKQLTFIFPEPPVNWRLGI